MNHFLLWCEACTLVRLRYEEFHPQLLSVPELMGLPELMSLAELY